jgi:hypothetical protein
MSELKIQTEDWILWLLAAAMTMIVFLIEKTPPTVALSLVILAGLLVHPVLHLPLVTHAENQKIKLRNSAIVLVLLFVGVGAFGVTVWPSPKRAHLMVYRYDISPPLNGNPAYFNVFVRNEGELDGEMRIGGNILFILGPVPSPEQRGKFEDNAFEAMLKTGAYKTAPSLQVPAKNETYMSLNVPPADAETYVKLQNGGAAVLLTGRMIYTDKNGEHHTDFCLLVQKFQRPFIMCQRHNEAP